MTQFYSINPRRKKSIFDFLSVNTLLILINVVFYLSLLIYLGRENLFMNGFVNNYIALSLDNIKSLRLWTFLTSMFMHANFFHLLVNMISLLFVGSLIEKIIGRRRYFWFYIFSGLFAGLFYVLIEALFSSSFPAVGASGALFGLIGLLVLLTPNLPVYIMFIPIPIKMKYAGIGMLIILWIISVAGNLSIGNTAHLGGLIAGLIYGLYLRKKYKNKTRYISKQFS